MSTMNEIVKTLQDAVSRQTNQAKPTAYDTPAVVRRVEGDIAWVHIPDGVDETPVKMTINAKEGDQVQVRVSGGSAFMVGNGTAPPTDDAKAKQAYTIATVAEGAAENALANANLAKEAADTARGEAIRAGEAADRAEGKADDAAGAATSAQQSADSALVNLSTVQDVVGVLNWITAHGTMTLTSDVTVNPAHVYFVVDAGGDYVVGGTHYSIVSEPKDAELSTYYELTVDESVQNYVATHIVVDSEGLWIVPDAGGNKVLIAVGGQGHTYETAGTYIVGKVNNVDTVLAKFTTSGVTVGDEDGSSVEMTPGKIEIKDASRVVMSIKNEGTTTGFQNFGDYHLSESRQTSHALSGLFVSQQFSVDPSAMPESDSYLNGVKINPTDQPFTADAKVTVTRSQSKFALYFNANTGSITPSAPVIIEGKGISIAYEQSFSDESHIYLVMANTSSLSSIDYVITVATEIRETSYLLGNTSSQLGVFSVAEGFNTAPTGYYSHAEGKDTVAAGYYSHAEGNGTVAGRTNFDCSHAEGLCTSAIGRYSHAEGDSSEASGDTSHAEGANTEASGDYSHAEGVWSKAGGHYSHAQNYGTRASSDYQSAIGKYNVEDNSDAYALIIGNGTADNARSNALTVDWSGNIEAAGGADLAAMTKSGSVYSKGLNDEALLTSATITKLEAWLNS